MGFFSRKKKPKDEPVRQATSEGAPTGERRRRKAPRGESSQGSELARHEERVNKSARVQAQSARLAALVQTPGPVSPSSSPGGGALLSIGAWKERQRKLKEKAPSREAWDAGRDMRRLERADLEKAHRKQAKRDAWVEAELAKLAHTGGSERARPRPAPDDIASRYTILSDPPDHDESSESSSSTGGTGLEHYTIANVDESSESSSSTGGTGLEHYTIDKDDESESSISISISSSSSRSQTTSGTGLNHYTIQQDEESSEAPSGWELSLDPDPSRQDKERREALFNEWAAELLEAKQLAAEAIEDGNDDDFFSITEEEVGLTDEERIELQTRVDEFLGFGARDVQKLFSGASLAEGVRMMQKRLRENARAHEDAQSRRLLSPSEIASTGWALLPMIAIYAAYDRGEALPENSEFKTRYMFNAGDDLDARGEQKLGTEQVAGREQALISYKNGEWVSAAGLTLSSTGLGINNQAWNERKDRLGEVVEEIKREVREAREDGEDALAERLAAWQKRVENKRKVAQLNQHKSVQGRYIFVMDAAGEFYAAPGEQWVVHHSSLLAGGAVAVAGEMGIEDGRLTSISNVSGHYKPSPAYLWQAVKQLDMLGVPLDDVAVYVAGVKSYFRSAKDFLAAMNPAAEARLFDPKVAIARLNGITSEARKQRRAAKRAGEGETPR